MSRPLRRLVKPLPRPLVHRIKRGVSRPVSRHLDFLAVPWGTDKAPGHHAYTAYYAQHLRGVRRSVRSVLEIGVGGYEDPCSWGNSLRMWRSYFPNATVYGVDLYEKRLTREPRIVTLRADQSDRESLQGILDACPRFDLIDDDGSHLARDTITTFEVLFPSLSAGGLYVIEDLETAYWPEYGGGPPGTPGTPVAVVKALVDDVNTGARAVAALHVYPGIIFIEKA